MDNLSDTPKNTPRTTNHLPASFEIVKNRALEQGWSNTYINEVIMMFGYDGDILASLTRHPPAGGLTAQSFLTVGCRYIATDGKGAPFGDTYEYVGIEKGMHVFKGVNFDSERPTKRFKVENAASIPRMFVKANPYVQTHIDMNPAHCAPVWNIKQLKAEIDDNLSKCRSDVELGMCKALAAKSIRDMADNVKAIRKLTPAEQAIVDHVNYEWL